MASSAHHQHLSGDQRHLLSPATVESTRCTQQKTARRFNHFMAEGRSAFLLASTASGFKERPQCGAGLRWDRSLFLGRLIETQRQDAGKSRHQPCDTVAPHGSHASLFVSVGVLVDCVSVWPHQQCSYAGTCSFSFPFNAVLLTLRTPGLATFVNNQFLPEPQRQCCGILFGPPQSLAACLYRSGANLFA